MANILFTIIFRHVFTLKAHLYELDFIKRVTTYFSPEYKSCSCYSGSIHHFKGFVRKTATEEILSTQQCLSPAWMHQNLEDVHPD